MPPPASEQREAVRDSGRGPGVCPPAVRPSRNGVRPNSPPQMMSVSSSRPRCFRSLISAATGLSIVRALLGQAVADVLARAGAVEVPAPVEELHEAHALLDQPAGEQAVVREARAARAWRRRPRAPSSAPREMSITSGTDDLHAEGELVLRDARQRFGMAELLRLQFVQVLAGRRGSCRRMSRSMPGGSET